MFENAEYVRLKSPLHWAPVLGSFYFGYFLIFEAQQLIYFHFRTTDDDFAHDFNWELAYFLILIEMK